MNPAVPDVLPWFSPRPGEPDTLLAVTAVILLIGVLLIGVLYFWLHSLPERLGHKKLQFQVVAVLGLLALFTHVHAFWIVGLLLAVIDLPDFLAPLRRIADASEKIAGIVPAPEAMQVPAEPVVVAAPRPASEPEASPAPPAATPHPKA
jgi:hypothetical protein